MLYIVFLTNFTDTLAYLAYLAGRRWGKTTPVPHLSPNKTSAGYLVALMLAPLLGIGMATLLKLNLALPTLFILSLGIACATLIGDLFASLVKRTLALKDFGNILPGHGGLLDRLDSLFFTIPTYLAITQTITALTH